MRLTLVGKAQGRRNACTLYSGLSSRSRPLALCLPELGHGHGVCSPGQFRLHNPKCPAGIAVTPGPHKLAPPLIRGTEGHARVDHGLPLERVVKIILRNVDVGKDVQIRQPVKARAGGLFVSTGVLFPSRPQARPVQSGGCIQTRRGGSSRQNTGRNTAWRRRPGRSGPGEIHNLRPSLLSYFPPA